MKALPSSRSNAINWLLRIAVSAPFLVAGVAKIIDPKHFAEVIENYRILPHELTHLLAIQLPWIELVAGILVLSGIWLRAATALIAVMTLVFIAAISSAVFRNLNIECGCFGTAGGREVGLRTIAMDVVLLACAVWLMWRTRTEPNRAPYASHCPGTAP